MAPRLKTAPGSTCWGHESYQVTRDSDERQAGAGTAQYASCKVTSKAVVIRLGFRSASTGPDHLGEIAGALAGSRCKYLVLDLGRVRGPSMGLAMCIDVRKSYANRA